jgi:putative transposase
MLIEAWRKEYNDSRPHASLADRTPSEFASHYADSRVMAETKTSCGQTSDLVQET